MIFDSKGFRIALAQGFHPKLLSSVGSSEWQQSFMRNQFERAADSLIQEIPFHGMKSMSTNCVFRRKKHSLLQSSDGFGISQVFLFFLACVRVRELFILCAYYNFRSLFCCFCAKNFLGPPEMRIEHSSHLYFLRSPPCT